MVAHRRHQTACGAEHRRRVSDRTAARSALVGESHRALRPRWDTQVLRHRNDSSANDQTNFTGEQEVLHAQVGLNLTQAWQLRYTLRLRAFDVLPGTLPRIPSIYTLFPAVRGLHTTKELLHRLAIVYDTRDDVTVPTRGMEWVAYGGLASRAGILNDSLYSEAGVDGRVFWPIARN